MRHTVLFFILFSIPLSSAIAQESSFSFYTPVGKLNFPLSTDKIMIQFVEGVSYNDKAALLKRTSVLQPLDSSMLLSSPGLAVGILIPNMDADKVIKATKQLCKSEQVAFAVPFLRYRQSTEIALSGEINIRLRTQKGINHLRKYCGRLQLGDLSQNEYDPMVYHLEFRWKHSPLEAIEAANSLHQSGLVQFAEPAYYLSLKPFTTNDPLLNYQWGLHNTGSATQYYGIPGADISAFEAWNITTGSPNIKIAIIDEGVDLYHPDLIPNLVGGFDATGLGSNGHANSTDAHGTACAGIAAAAGNNGIGIAGIAYSSKIVPIRIAYQDGQGEWVTYTTWQANALNWAWQNGDADILSNSWGGSAPNFFIESAIDNALNYGRGGLGCPVLFSAGNENSTVTFPASYNGAIAVGATSYCDERKSPFSCDGEDWGSCYGLGLDVSAPGVKIMTTDISSWGGYDWGDYTGIFNGTSSACPAAAGTMALILSVNPSLTANQARQILESTCDKTGGYLYQENTPWQPNGSWSSELGYGRINAYQAVLAALNGGGSGCEPPSNIQVTNSAYSHCQLNWSAAPSATAYQTRIRATGNSEWVESPSYNIAEITWANLTPCAQYEVQVRSVCNNGQSNYSESAIVNTKGCNDPYCYSYGLAWNDWIEKVNLNNIDMVSGQDYGYANFTHLNAQIQKGSNTSIQLKAGTNGSFRNVYWRIWIDFNQDYDFDDAGEMVGQLEGSNSSTVNSVIFIPYHALSGSTRMRVSMSTDGFPAACETGGNREVEDYQVIIYGNSTNVDEAKTDGKMDLTIYPNPASDHTTVSFNLSKKDNINITIFDMQGRLLEQVQHEVLGAAGTQTVKLDLASYPKGVYMLKIGIGQQIMSKKMVIH
jgi:subtilisin family serine protease